MTLEEFKMQTALGIMTYDTQIRLAKSYLTDPRILQILTTFRIPEYMPSIHLCRLVLHNINCPVELRPRLMILCGDTYSGTYTGGATTIGGG